MEEHELALLCELALALERRLTAYLDSPERELGVSWAVRAEHHCGQLCEALEVGRSGEQGLVPLSVPSHCSSLSFN